MRYSFVFIYIYMYKPTFYGHMVTSLFLNDYFGYIAGHARSHGSQMRVF